MQILSADALGAWNKRWIHLVKFLDHWNAHVIMRKHCQTHSLFSIFNEHFPGEASSSLDFFHHLFQKRIWGQTAQDFYRSYTLPINQPSKQWNGLKKLTPTQGKSPTSLILSILQKKGALLNCLLYAGSLMPVTKVKTMHHQLDIMCWFSHRHRTGRRHNCTTPVAATKSSNGPVCCCCTLFAASAYHSYAPGGVGSAMCVFVPCDLDL